MQALHWLHFDLSSQNLYRWSASQAQAWTPFKSISATAIDLSAGMGSVVSAIRSGLQSSISSERMVSAVALARWARNRQSKEQLPVILQLSELCQTQLASGGASGPPEGYLELEYMCRGIRPRLTAVLKHLAEAGWNPEVPFCIWQEALIASAQILSFSVPYNADELPPA